MGLIPNLPGRVIPVNINIDTLIKIIIIIILKGTIQDFYNLLIAPRTVSIIITCNTPSVYHMQHVWHMVWRDNSAIKFDRV